MKMQFFFLHVVYCNPATWKILYNSFFLPSHTTFKRMFGVIPVPKLQIMMVLFYKGQISIECMSVYGSIFIQISIVKKEKN